MKKIIERTKQRLGYPLRTIEISDDQFKILFEIAEEVWTLYSNLSTRGSLALTNIQTSWINSYFSALSKETLGRVRGKFGGELSLPDSDTKLDYESLLHESAIEKERLINIL